jgi:serine/threonine protein phosphatase PrpC
MECDLGVVAGVSDRGLRRARNEDSMAFGAVGRTGSTRAVVAIVCDGVASSERADEASQAASDAAVEVLLVALMDEDSFPSDATNDAVRAAFAAVDALVRPNESPSCTYVSAVVADGKVTVGWLGDSRAYWIGDDSAAQQLTIDDTVVSLLVAAGVNAEQAMADPNAHALARWVGSDAEDREPQVRTFRPEGPGAIVLCSDGLWNYRPSLDTFEAAVRTGAATPGTRSAASTAEALTTLALDSGGHDNVTVVVVPIPFTDQHGSPSA